MNTLSFLLANKLVARNATRVVINPYTQEIVGAAALPTEEDIAAALTAAAQALKAYRLFPAFKRAAALTQIAQGISEDHEALAQLITNETGKTIKDSRVEVTRAIETFTLGAEAARAMDDEMISLDHGPGFEHMRAIIRRVPKGIVFGIAPFNFPLNLVAHKLAPAIACGAPIILKPASKTPLIAYRLGEIISACDLPAGSVSMLLASHAQSDHIMTDERVRVVTFTGSPAVGWNLPAKLPGKTVLLELGGNAAVIVDETADQVDATEKIVKGGFTANGQSCISVQRVYVHDSIYADMRDRLVARTQKLIIGDPRLDTTDIGPLVETDSVNKIKQRLEAAVTAGATILTGGVFQQQTLLPTIIENAPPELELCTQEAFAPLIILFPFTTLEEAIAGVNHSVYGLQAGLFSNSLANIRSAFDELEVGGLMVNNASSFRADRMPYGGTKQSGNAREGVRYAIEEYTERKVLTIKL